MKYGLVRNSRQPEGRIGVGAKQFQRWLTHLYFPVDGLVFSPNGEDGNKKRGRPGAYGRSVLKTVNADTEPKIISLLLPSSIETLMPASLDAAGLVRQAWTAGNRLRFRLELFAQETQTFVQ